MWLYLTSLCQLPINGKERVLRKKTACWLQIETLRDAYLSNLNMDTHMLQLPFQIPEQNMGADSNSLSYVVFLHLQIHSSSSSILSLGIVLTKTFPSNSCVQGMHQQGAENS